MRLLMVGKIKEDNDLFERLIRNHFPKLELTICTDGALAEEQFRRSEVFDIVVLDTRMDKGEVQDLFKLACESNQNYPVLCLGSLATLQSSSPASLFEKNEVNDVFVFPQVDIPKFKKIFYNAIRWIEAQREGEATVELDRSHFVPIKIRNFYRFDRLPYDAYLELSETKFVKIINKGDQYTEADIQKYIIKGVRFIYLEKDEHLEYLINMSQGLLKIYQQKMPLGETIRYQIKAASVIHEHIRTIGITDYLVDLTKETLELAFVKVRSIRQLRDFYAQFPVVLRDSAERAILTLYTSLVLLESLGWSSDIAKNKLGLASMIHDSTLSNDEMVTITSLDDYAMFDFSEEEQEEYKEHPIKAAEVANLYPGFTETDFIIQQHHELPNGTGFPHGLNASQITGLSCLFIVANNFVNHLTSEKITAQSLQKAIYYISDNYKEAGFKEPSRALKSLFKLS